MIGRVHLNQRAHQIRSAGDLADALDARPCGQDRRTISIMKELVLAADGQDMRVFGDDPERVEFLGPCNSQRIVGTEPAIAVMQAVIGVGGRIDEGRRNLRGNVDIPVQGRCHIHGFFSALREPLYTGLVLLQSKTNQSAACFPCRESSRFDQLRHSVLALSSSPWRPEVGVRSKARKSGSADMMGHRLQSRRSANRLAWSLALAALCLAWPVSIAAAQSADTVLFNGKILTVDKDFSVQQALAIGSGKVLATGTSAAMKK